MRGNSGFGTLSKRRNRPAGIDYPDTQPENEAEALIEWVKATLIVPPGHHLEGTAMALPEYGEKFIRAALDPSCKDALLCMGRKGAKTAIIACVVLYFLVGPGRRRGWRCALASTSRETAGELRRQIQDIAEASSLTGIDFWKRSSPAITTEGGSVDVLSADKNAAIARGADLVCLRRDREVTQEKASGAFERRCDRRSSLRR